MNTDPRGLLETIGRWSVRESFFTLTPDFQRPLCWEPEEESMYMERLLQGHQQGIDFYFNHPHWGGSKYQTICIEKLKIGNMVKNRCLSKSISDSRRYLR